MSADATRARGRPRSTAADRAIFEATRRLLDVAGYQGLTVEGVAASAGVAKTTIYRRYANKALLVLDAMTQASHDAPVALPDTGTFHDDLIAVAHLVRAEIAPSSPSSVGSALLAEASQDPAVAEGLRAFADFRFEQGKPVYDRAIARGELRADADWRVIAELLVGWIFHATIVSRRTPDDATLERTIDLLLAGLAPR
ncbi:MAG TPA: TetR/AcrR family transcriptional regulator [Baekduia sp.]